MTSEPSDNASDTNDASQHDPAAKVRLVIRAEIRPPDPPAELAPQWNWPAIAFALGLVVLLSALGVWGVRAWLQEPPTPTTHASTPPAAADIVEESQPATPTATASTHTAAPSKPVAVAAPVTPAENTPTTAVDTILPEVPQSALDTIRGTVRVAIRVSINDAGKVIDATADDPGPSRYFERLSLQAAQQWTFTPATTQTPRAMLVRFFYTREGRSAQATEL